KRVLFIRSRSNNYSTMIECCQPWKRWPSPRRIALHGAGETFPAGRLVDFLCFDAKMVATNSALTQNKSMPLRRYLETPIREDLPEKMVFVAGPRQVGKTTLAQQILATVESGIYLNWDSREDR